MSCALRSLWHLCCEWCSGHVSNFRPSSTTLPWGVEIGMREGLCVCACMLVCVCVHTCLHMCSLSRRCRIWDISSQRKHHEGFFRRVGGTHRIPSCARTNWSLSSSRCGVCRLGWSSLYIRWEVMWEVSEPFHMSLDCDWLCCVGVISPVTGLH